MGSDLSQGRPDSHLTRHLKGMELEELFAAGEAVEQLAVHPGWGHVTGLLRAEIAEVDRKLDRNETPLSQADYALAHGRRGGLRTALEVVEAILHRYRAELEAQRRRHEGDPGRSLEVTR